MPETANLDQIKAKYDNGVLKLNIPKKEEERPLQRINIQWPAVQTLCPFCLLSDQVKFSAVVGLLYVGLVLLVLVAIQYMVE